MIRYIFFLLLFFPAIVFAENETDTVNLLNFKEGISIEGFSKFKLGDNLSWSAVNLDDKDWLVLNDTSDIDTLLDVHEGIAWFRVSYFVDSLLEGIPLALQTRTTGACEIFADGKLIRSLGKVGRSAAEEVSGFSVRMQLVPIPYTTKGWHQLSFRCSSFGRHGNFGVVNLQPGFTLASFDADIISLQKAIEEKDDITAYTITMFFSGVFIVLSIFHLILFLYYRKNRSNLYYSLFTFLLFFVFFGVYRTIYGTDITTTIRIVTLEGLSIVLIPLFFIGILYDVFYKRLLKLFWILTGAYVVGCSLLLFTEGKGLGATLLFLFILTAFVETIRVIIRGLIKKREGVKIFAFGLIFPVIGIIAIGIICWILTKAGFPETADMLSENTGAFFGYSMLMSVSLSMTIYLARDFARMNKKLHEQIKEIKQLFDRTIEQESERKSILENQKDELERMVILRTEEVVKQKAEIELKNRDILDNLLYARRIQEAILPEMKLIFETLRDSFILYWPKDIVSGDFYSFSQRDGKVIIAAADCTGHGVTGAFMSMIGSSILNQIINQQGVTQPSLILNELKTGISEALKQNDNDVNDGMDIALCTIDLNTLAIQYSGANRPLWIFRDGNLNEVKADKIPIGGFQFRRNATFHNHELNLKKGDSIYLFTDGFSDQFGGPNGKKMLTKRFRELLISIQHLPMKEQEKKLTEIFREWQGGMTQVDDVLVIGIRF